MKSKSSGNNQRFFIYIGIILCLTICSVILHYRLLANASDDAYIHIRIADNLSRFGQPYFNLNEAVFATSSIAWTILLALLFLVFPAEPVTISVLNGILIILASLMISKTILVYLPSHKLKNLAFASFALATYMLLYLPSIQLMETVFAIFVFSLTTYLFLSKKPVALILAGVLPFIRLEFFLFTIILVMIEIYQQKNYLRKAIAFVVIGALPFLLFELVNFQTLIPNTVLAKSTVYDLSYWQKVFEILISIYPLPYQPYLVAFIALPLTMLVVFLMIFILTQFLGLLGSEAIPQKRTELLIAAVFMFSIGVMGIYIIGRSAHFDWYTPLYSVPLVIAVSAVSLQKKNYVLAFFSIILIIKPVIFFSTSLPYSIKPENKSTLSVASARVGNYIEIGRWLNKYYPERTLLTSEIGGLGFGFKGKIIDGAGLISPEALKYHPMQVPEERDNGNIGAIPLKFIQSVQPDLIVSYDLFNKQFLDSGERDNYIWLKIPPINGYDAAKYAEDSWFQEINIFIQRDIFEPSNLPPAAKIIEQ